VGFLGVVIRPNGIKIEKKKVKGILEWLTSRCVKDVVIPEFKIPQKCDIERHITSNLHF